MAENYIILKNICKNYERIQAVRNIDFSVPKGELFGLIGPDGAGKTTLFRILATLLLPDSGTATLAGWDIIKDFKKIRRHIGYMPGRFSLYQDLSVEENLRFFANIYYSESRKNIRENYALIKDIYQQIEEFKTRPAGKLSGGMKQKLALCCALIHKPQILFLDEPTTGVDAVSRIEFWEILKKLKESGITIIVSTPYMDEAEKCSCIALIENGNILDINNPGHLKEKYPYSLISLTTDNMEKLGEDIRQFKSLKLAFRSGDHVRVSFAAKNIPAEKLKTFLRQKGHKEIRINPLKAKIEDCFMALMKQ